MPPRTTKSNPDKKVAEEAQQKEILIVLVGLIGALLLAAGAWTLIGGMGSGGSGKAEVSEDEAPAEVGEEVIDGLGDNWEERLAEAEAAVDRIMEKPAEDRMIIDDSVFVRQMGKAKSALADAKRESTSGDPVEARKAVAAVLESEEALDNYLEAKEVLREIVERYNEARDMALEFKLQSFQSELYKKALAFRQEAESATADGKVEEASAAYESAIESLQQAKQRFDETIARARQSTIEAQRAGNREAGEAAVQKILERLPGDEFGERMRGRLAVLDQTHPLYRKATASEENKLLSVAEGQYRSILEKDPHHKRAKDGLNRVVEARKVVVVEQRIAEAEAFEKKGDLSEALKLAEQALILNPDHKVAQELKRDLQTRFDRQRIQQSLKRGAAHEEAGEWEEAMALYSALKSDFPGLKDAKDGAARVSKAAQQVKEARQLKDIAKQSINVGSVAELEYATGLLEKATRLNPKDKSIAVLLEATREDLKLMNAPIRVTLVSDGQTNVQIWKVGEYENVTEVELDLKPGSYTVEGKKRYYVSVKLDLTVPAGAEPMRFEVKCEEAL